MIGKIVLPVYGGVPAIWNVCMLFFQSILLAGYAYAHLSMKHFSLKWQSILLSILFLASLWPLHQVMDLLSVPPEGTDPALWLLRRLVLTISVPIFAISSLAPLLQRWFSFSGHRLSSDPYFLYAASNAGSVAALFFYPLILERYLTTGKQNTIWFSGFGVLGLMVAICGILILRVGSYEPSGNPSMKQSKPEATTWSQRTLWLGLSFAPSSLMLGVTTYITTDLTPMPLLWIIPLTLYLFTFVMAFSRKKLLSHQTVIKTLPFIIIPLAPTFFFQMKLGIGLIPLHLLMFFFAALGCHGEMARRRPSAEKLTEFYFSISAGGALGGVCNALIYPYLFNNVTEYPLAMFFACLVLMAFKTTHPENHSRISKADILMPVSLMISGVIIISCTGFFAPEKESNHFIILLAIIFAPMGLITFGAKDRPLRFVLFYGVILLSLGMLTHIFHGNTLYISRNFYGVKKVTVDQRQTFRSLIHGSTIHGMQRIGGPGCDEPLSYYHRTGPLGDIFKALHKEKQISEIAIVGLGIGSIASYTDPGEKTVFYEIDPEIKTIATNTTLFTFLSNTRGSCSIILGDARLKLQEAPAAAYDMIILDAFSSDSIPTHLLTSEAIQLYLSKIKPDGLLVFHISNRHVNLGPMIARHSADHGMICMRKFDLADKNLYPGKRSAEYAVIGNPDSPIKKLFINKTWRRIEASQDVVAWTDQYSSILGYLKFDLHGSQ